MSDKVYLGPNVADLDYDDKVTKITRVNLIVDTDNMYTSGDDTGRTLEVSCPWGAQAMADSILAKVGAVDYQPYTVGNALLDPAAEIGDGITVGGIYSVLAAASISFDKQCAGNITAPYTDEIDDEYPYITPQQRAMTRQLAQARSLITKTAEEIKLQVEATDGRVSNLTQYVDSLTLSVSNGSTSSTITLKAGETAIASQTIQMDGLVTFTGLSSGTTTIDGACIKTGTISANRLNLTGAITWSDLSSSVQGDIDDAWSMAYNAQSLANDVDDVVSGWTYGSTTYIDGSQLMTGTVSASTLKGGEIYLLNSSGVEAGSFTLTGASSYSGQAVRISSGAISIMSLYGDIFLISNKGASIDMGADISCNTNVLCSGYIRPTSSGSYSCGTSSYKWSDIYCANATIQTSDLTTKNSLVYGLDAYDVFFDSLKPMSFLFNDGTSGRRHVGLGSQDVEQALVDSGLTSLDFAGFIKSPRLDENDQAVEGEYDYGLRYGEFVALNIWQIQQLKARVAELERKFVQ